MAPSKTRGQKGPLFHFRLASGEWSHHFRLRNTWAEGPLFHFRLASGEWSHHFRFRNTWAEGPSFLFPVVWRQNGLGRQLHMAAGLGWLARGGYMCRLRSVAGTGAYTFAASNCKTHCRPSFGWSSQQNPSMGCGAGACSLSYGGLCN